MIVWSLKPLFTESVLLERIGKNTVSIALFLVQKALLSHRKDQNSSATKRLLEVKTLKMSIEYHVDFDLIY